MLLGLQLVFRYSRAVVFIHVVPPLQPTSIPANAPIISSATPPFSTTIFVTWLTSVLFMPPLGGVQTPLLASISRIVRAWALVSGTVPPVAEFMLFGTAGGVRWLGGSMVLIDTILAPVLDPGADRRAVSLPRGRWYDTVTGQAYEGPGQVLIDAPLSRIPVLARAGAVVPVRGDDGGLELEAWAPAPGRTGGTWCSCPPRRGGPRTPPHRNHGAVT